MLNLRMNGISIDDLIDCYDKFNFLYPAKKEKLTPYLPIILKNWRKAMGLPWEYFMLLTHRMQSEEKNEFSSVSAWRHSHSTYNIQHMVSSNAENTRLTLHDFLEYLTRDVRNQNAVQVYYQRKTNFANKMFNHLVTEIGPSETYMTSYSFMSFPFLVKSNPTISISTKQFGDLDENRKNTVLSFLKKERSSLYTRLQDIDSTDYRLANIDGLYKKYGLFRNREILCFYNDNTGQLIGVIIMNKASLGLNFSLLENSAELIVDRTLLNSILINEILHFMLVETRDFYKEMKLSFLPLLIAPLFESKILAIGGKKLRNYDYFICSNKAYPAWKSYLVDELLSVKSHIRNKALEKMKEAS